MSKDNKKYLVQLIGPAGVVRVSGKPQRFIEEAPSRFEVERRLVDRKMDIDPIMGSNHYGGQFIGCWIDIRELPDPHATR
jgi:hypothetical protein